MPACPRGVRSNRYRKRLSHFVGAVASSISKWTPWTVPSSSPPASQSVSRCWMWLLKTSSVDEEKHSSILWSGLAQELMNGISGTLHPVEGHNLRRQQFGSYPEPWCAAWATLFHWPSRAPSPWPDWLPARKQRRGRAHRGPRSHVLPEPRARLRTLNEVPPAGCRAKGIDSNRR